MRITEDVAPAHHVRHRDSGLERIRSEWSERVLRAYNGVAEQDAALLTVPQEEVDAVNARTVLGACIQGDTLNDVGTRVDPRARRRIGHFELDGGTVTAHRLSLGQQIESQ